MSMDSQVLWAVRVKGGSSAFEVISEDECVEQVDGGSLGLRVFYPKVTQMGSCVTREAFACFKPGTA